MDLFPTPCKKCDVRIGSGNCESLHPISHMTSEKWEVGLKRGFPFLKYPTLKSQSLASAAAGGQITERAPKRLHGSSESESVIHGGVQGLPKESG